MEAPVVAPLTQLPPNAEEFVHKSRLNQYALKVGVPLPSYYSINEGFDHAPRFRCSVTFGGRTFTSPQTFSNKKAAEHYVAKYALDEILANITNITNQDNSLILNDNVFSKSMLNEYAMKMNMEFPKYEISQPEATYPAFVSSVSFGGKDYTGRAGRNKKEAERLGACVVIESILGSDMDKVMSNIIRAKGKLCTPIYRETGSSSVHVANMPMGPTYPISSTVSSGDGKQLVYLSETGNSLAAIQSKAISYELPSSDNVVRQRICLDGKETIRHAFTQGHGSSGIVQIEGMPCNSMSLPLSSAMVYRTSRKRKKKNKGQSLVKKPSNEQFPQSGPSVSSAAPESSSTISQELPSTEPPKPSSIHEVPPTEPSEPSTTDQKETLPASDEVSACPSNV